MNETNYTIRLRVYDTLGRYSDDHIYVFGGVQTFLHANKQHTVPSLSSVEAYNPEFQSKGVEPEGKLITPWGQIKSD